MSEQYREPPPSLFWDDLLAGGFVIWFFVNHHAIHIASGWTGWAAFMGIISIGWLGRSWYLKMWD